jgi:hypothetical protein
MSLLPSNSTEPGETPRPSAPSRGAIATVVVAISLLGALVWALHTSQPRITPAPLVPVSSECPQLRRAFIPSNYTDLPGLPLDRLSHEQRNRALYRLNTEPCPCGCNLSVAACRVYHPACEACRQLAEKIITEVQAEKPKRN